MRTAARIFGSLLVIAGIIYGAMAIFTLSTVDGIAATLELSRATEHKEFGFVSIEDWKNGLLFNAGLYLVVGSTAAVCGVGIAAHKEWARLSWLVISILLFGFMSYVAVRHTAAWVRYVDLLVFAVPSFVVLRRRLGSTESPIE